LKRKFLMDEMDVKVEGKVFKKVKEIKKYDPIY
jgi:hypothetical protein